MPLVLEALIWYWDSYVECLLLKWNCEDLTWLAGDGGRVLGAVWLILIKRVVRVVKGNWES